MFTKIDKAIVSLIMAVLFIVNHTAGINLGFDEDTVIKLVDAILLIGGTAATYKVPNKT